MKNNLSVLRALIAIACAAVFVTGCGTMPEDPEIPTQTAVTVDNENRGGFGEIRLLPVKDFVSVGLVFTENQFETSSNGVFDGTTFTYQALLKEAQKLGADAIINVIIDRMGENITKKQGNVVVGRGRRETWRGSALAIKYTDPLKEEYRVQAPSNDYQSDTGASNSVNQPAAPAKPAQPKRTGFQ